MKTWLVILFLFVQALSADTKSEKSDKQPREPAKTETAKTEPAKTEPAKTEPAKADKPENKADKPERPSEKPPHAVCIEVTRRIPSAAMPYNGPSVKTIRATGIQIGKRIVTELENVRGAISLTVRQPDQDTATQGRLLFSGWDTGMAVIVSEEGDDKAPLIIPDIPAITLDQEFGVSACSDRGLEMVRLRVDRIYESRLDDSDVGRFTLAGVSALGSIQPSASGAPVFSSGNLSGMFHSGKSNYVMPLSMIQRFLKDIDDGEYNGIPSLPFEYQPLSHPDLRRYLSLPSSLHGVRVTRSLAGTLLIPGDYVTALDGQPVSNDGKIGTGATAISIQAFGSRKLASTVNLTVNRGGREIVVAVPVQPSADTAARIRSTQDRRPFFYSAGLVFQNLDYELMHDTKAGADPQLAYRYFNRVRDRLNDESDRDVILTNLFPDAINEGAERFVWAPVESVNGVAVRRMEDLRAIVRSSANQYLVFKFRGRSGLLVIDRPGIPEGEKRIRGKYGPPDSLSEAAR